VRGAGGKFASATVKATAMLLAAGEGSSAQAARETGVSERSVQRWLAEADTGTVSTLIAAKSAIAARVASEHLESVTQRLWQALEVCPLDTAKDIRDASVSAGILIEKMRLNAGMLTTGTGGRFGTPTTDASLTVERVVLERIEQQAGVRKQGD
jgi:hypothetical protein